MTRKAIIFHGTGANPEVVWLPWLRRRLSERGYAVEVPHLPDLNVEPIATFLPKVLAGCLIGAFVAAILPREFVSRWIGGDSGLTGLLIATAIGAIMPGGPFTIYPLAGALLAIGAGVGPAIAFVTSWTLIGLNRAIIWEAPFLGMDFVTTRMLVSLPLPVLAGLFAHWLARLVPGAPR